ncbi:glycosyltransferase family 4 protein [Mucilaginibacter sp. HC2]|uniref:glycosyltransferase family 4 protein n=1 Tax=Mucilaginibacter inviolabilis TaxID=2714892 RepID=UPI00140DEDC3|nr:glycosyltransferase family 4 protein [Mucilaginibacter inviolabilis]NHA02947.1 glycosyltransferase family 4 protein [Mucilaginibacter inviolabilis]
MIKLVDLTYYAHLNYTHAAQVKENHSPALAFAPYLIHKIDFCFVKHASFEEHVVMDGVPYHFFKGCNRFWSITLKTHRFIKKLKPDIILVQGFIFPLQVIFLRLFCGRGFKIMIQHHGGLPFSGIKGWLQKIACSFADAFIFTAAGNAGAWKRRNIIKQDALIFELLEASTNFKQQDKQISKTRTQMTGEINLLWVGRLNANKDPMAVLLAFMQYLKIKPTAKLYMIYQSEDMINEVMALFASSKPLANAVVLVGRVANEELPYWYSAADFYISGSHKEGSGYALLEAMACGCVPLVTNIPPYQKITGNGWCGFLYPPGDVNALARLLYSVSNVDRKKLSDDVLIYFHQHLTFKNIADDLVRICEQIMTPIQASTLE